MEIWKIFKYCFGPVLLFSTYVDLKMHSFCMASWKTLCSHPLQTDFHVIKGKQAIHHICLEYAFPVLRNVQSKTITPLQTATTAAALGMHR